jgi:hypothetical protein
MKRSLDSTEAAVGSFRLPCDSFGYIALTAISMADPAPNYDLKVQYRTEW